MEPETAIQAARPSSAIDEATRHLSDRIDVLHKRLDELGDRLAPYCRPSHKPEDGDTIAHDRDVASGYREQLDNMANRVTGATDRVEDLLARAEL